MAMKTEKAIRAEIRKLDALRLKYERASRWEAAESYRGKVNMLLWVLGEPEIPTPEYAR